MSVVKVKDGYRVTEDFVVENPNLGKLKESSTNIIEIHAIHVGTTKNWIRYTVETLKDAESSWVKPYGKPVLKDHRDDADNTIGRVFKAEYSDHHMCTKLWAKIDDEDALTKIKDGRYLTVSIGSMVKEAKCSICGKSVVRGWCGHWRGERYKDGERSTEEDAIVCEWIPIKITHEEVSVVAIPADEKAQIVSLKGSSSIKHTGGEGMATEAMTPESVVESSNTTIPDSIKVVETASTPVAEQSEQETKAVAETTETEADAKADESEASEAEEQVYSYFYNEDGTEEDDKTDEAKLKSKTRSALPDSAFALVKTEGGKKVRKLPYKKADGSIDKNHLRNALARINQVQGFSAAAKARALAKLKRAAKKAGIEVSNESITVTVESTIIQLQNDLSALRETCDSYLAEIDELTVTINSLEMAVVKAVDEQNKALADVNASKESLHKERVNRLLDIKYLTNRESVRQRDEVFQEYVVKSDEMLLELINEYCKGIVLDKPPLITNETLPSKSEMDNDVVDVCIDIRTLERPNILTIQKALEGDAESQRIVESWTRLKSIGNTKEV